jgi:hypothetical protein
MTETVARQIIRAAMAGKRNLINDRDRRRRQGIAPSSATGVHLWHDHRRRVQTVRR